MPLGEDMPDLPDESGAAAQAGAAAGAGAGAATGTEAGMAAGAAEARKTGEVYMTAGARRATHRLAWAFVVLFLVVIGLLTASLLFTNNQAAINRCQRVVNARFQQADIARANATKASGEAQIELWNALLKLHGTQAQRLAQFNQAFSTYKARVHQVTAIRFPSETGTQACSG